MAQVACPKSGRIYCAFIFKLSCSRGRRMISSWATHFTFPFCWGASVGSWLHYRDTATSGMETDTCILQQSLAAKWIAIEEMQPAVWSVFSKHVLLFTSLLHSQHLGVRWDRRAFLMVPDTSGKIDWAICTWNYAIQVCFLKYACSFSLGMLMLCWGIPWGLVVLKTFF